MVHLVFSVEHMSPAGCLEQSTTFLLQQSITKHPISTRIANSKAPLIHKSTIPFNLPNLPNTITDPAVKKFIEKYYAVSEDKDVHDDYADLFATDGEFSINDKKAEGTKCKLSSFLSLLPYSLPSQSTLILLQTPITETKDIQKSATSAKQSGPTSPVMTISPFRSTPMATTR